MNSKLCNKVFTLLGSILFLLPGSVAWYWGSMSVYALSYIVCQHSDSQNVQVPWLISIFTVFWTGSMTIVAILEKTFGRRTVMLTTFFLNSVAMFSNYFAIQHSLFMLNLTLGVLCGITSGVCYGCGVQMVVETGTDDIGLLSSLIQTSHSIGSLIIVQLITWYVNPFNESPGLSLGSAKYFTQVDIIERVPDMFVVLGIFSFVVQVVGLLLLQFNPSMKFCRRSFTSFKSETIFPENPDETSKLKAKSKLIKDEYRQDTNRVVKSLSINSDAEEPSSKTEKSSDHKTNEPIYDYTPREMLKTAKFYALWVSFALADFPFMLLMNYYKIFGEVFIKDDHFLTDVGTAFIVVNCLSRAPWGVALDKFGSRICLVVMLSSIVIGSSWFYFTPMISRYLYLLVVIIFGSFAGALYACYLGATAFIFGRKYVSTNYGFILSSSVLFNIVAPTMVDAILTKYGWFATFAVGGGVNIISLILCSICLP